MKTQTIGLALIVALLSIPSASRAQSALDEDAMWLTLRVQEGIHFDMTLYDQILSELPIARSVDDAFLNYHTKSSYFLSKLEVYFDSSDQIPPAWLASELLAGEEYLDSLGQEYHLSQVTPMLSAGYVELSFDDTLEMIGLGEVYMAHPSIRLAEPNFVTVFGEDIERRTHNSDVFYIFSDLTQFDDVNDHYTYVALVDGGANVVFEDTYTSIGEEDTTIYHLNVPRLFNPVAYDSLGELIDSMTTSQNWWVREHALESSRQLLENFFFSPVGFFWPDSTWWIRTLELRDELMVNTLGLEAAVQQVAAGSDTMLAELAGEVESQLQASSWYGMSGSGLKPFHLLTPEVYPISSTEMVLNWQPSFSPDSSDSYEYVLHCLDYSYPFEEIKRLSTTQPSIILGDIGLIPDERYQWWVEARNLSDTTISRCSYEKRYVSPSQTGAPLPFEPLSPIQDTLMITTATGELNFSWTLAQDPEFPGPMNYGLFLRVSVSDSADSIGVYEVKGDTNLVVNIVDLLDRPVGGTPLQAEWRVTAWGGREHIETPMLIFYVSEGSDVESVNDPITSPGPANFEISALYPNPFNPSATIALAMPEQGRLTLEVFNLLGQRVAVLVDGVVPQGWRNFVFDGSGLASGVYLVRATVPDKLNETRRITLVR